jgi:uroporphyrinogen decarboxylase
VINFSTGNPALLPLMKEAGGDVIGLDWRCDLAEAWSVLGDDVAVMGNMDPIILYTSPKEIRAQVQAILDKAAGRPGHIFNLGHGILPDMPPENVAELVDAVHELSMR